jgi:hypothetical protein
MIAQAVLGETPEQFKNIVNNVPHYNDKLNLLEHAAQQAIKTGLWAEFGVYSGTSLKLLTKSNSPVYGFDSFEGLPEHWNDENPKGEFNTGGQPPFEVSDDMKLVIGWFEDTLPTFIETNTIKTPSLLHLDADLYSSTKTVLDAFKPHFKGQCTLVFDEFYNYPDWENHEYKALYEFLIDMEDKIYSVERIGYSMNTYCSFAFNIMFK